MPTILFIYGWRLFFYSNEGNEPIHIHAEKGDMECKFWLIIDEVEIKEEFSYNMTPTSKKEIKKIIYQHFDLIVDSWHNYFKNYKMVTTHIIDSIKFVQNFLVIKVDGKEYFFELKTISEKLNAASEMQRNLFKISPSGYGIHWPLLDEDLSISSLFQNQ